MKRLQVLVPVLALALVGCDAGAPPPAVAPAASGLSLTTASKERLAGTFKDDKGNLVQFDTAKVGDDIFIDLKGNGGFPLLHVATTPDAYVFSYMGGKLKMTATKAVVAQARATAQQEPDAVSTDGFQWDGDMNALDEMMQRPEVAALPYLSRALGAAGYTGMDFPASLALHKVARQSAEGLGIQVQPIEANTAANGYCTAYPNQGDSCYGMCGSGCSCWSWVCGDCCYHYGCAVHDSWCRSGQWYYCYNITAVIALFGC